MLNANEINSNFKRNYLPSGCIEKNYLWLKNEDEFHLFAVFSLQVDGKPQNSVVVSENLVETKV